MESALEAVAVAVERGVMKVAGIEGRGVGRSGRWTALRREKARRNVIGVAVVPDALVVGERKQRAAKKMAAKKMAGGDARMTRITCGIGSGSCRIVHSPVTTLA